MHARWAAIAKAAIVSVAIVRAGGCGLYGGCSHGAERRLDGGGAAVDSDCAAGSCASGHCCETARGEGTMRCANATPVARRLDPGGALLSTRCEPNDCGGSAVGAGSAAALNARSSPDDACVIDRERRLAVPPCSSSRDATRLVLAPDAKGIGHRLPSSGACDCAGDPSAATARPASRRSARRHRPIRRSLRGGRRRAAMPAGALDGLDAASPRVPTFGDARGAARPRSALGDVCPRRASSSAAYASRAARPSASAIGSRPRPSARTPARCAPASIARRLLHAASPTRPAIHRPLSLRRVDALASTTAASPATRAQSPIGGLHEDDAGYSSAPSGASQRRLRRGHAVHPLLDAPVLHRATCSGRWLRAQSRLACGRSSL